MKKDLTPLSDSMLFKRFKTLETFDEKEKTTVIHVIDKYLHRIAITS